MTIVFFTNSRFRYLRTYRNTGLCIHMPCDNSIFETFFLYNFGYKEFGSPSAHTMFEKMEVPNYPDDTPNCCNKTPITCLIIQNIYIQGKIGEILDLSKVEVRASPSPT